MIQRRKVYFSFVLLFMAVLISAGTAFGAPGETGCNALAAYVSGLTDSTFGWPVFNVSATWNAATSTIPEYCQIKGWMWPQLQFQVSLPTTWNGRQIHFGGGGWDGSLGGPTAGIPTTLTMGYAYDSSNGGYDATVWPSNSGSFGLKDPYFRMDFPSAGKDNPNACQMVVDFGLRAHKESPTIARKIINQYYGSYPAYTYYSGQSCGGKEGQISAQKFYDIYDGYFIGCPLGGHMTVAYRGMWDNVKAKDLAALVDPTCTGWFCATIYSQYKAALHYRTVYDKCDGVDGLVDGLIDDPRNCKFNALTDLPACTPAQEADGTGRTSTTCFTLAQRQALAEVYAGPHDSNGKSLYPGQPLGAEYVTAGPFGSSGFTFALGDPMANGMFQFIALDPPPGPAYDGSTFNWDTDTKTVQRTTCTQCYDANAKCTRYNIHNTLDGITLAASPKFNMGGFGRVKSKGAKIIQAHGWADSLVSAYAASAYLYENALKAYGVSGTKSFYKLYMVPGQGHCGGGLGINPAWADVFTALTNWVENGVEPTTITGSRAANTDANFPNARTRPICFYPEVARWDGEGSIDVASSFSCVPPIDVRFSPSTISLSNTRTVTATITVPNGYVMRDWNLGSLTLEGASAISGSVMGRIYTARFNVADMTGVTPGTGTLTVKGQFSTNSKDALVQAANTVTITN